MSPSGGHVRLVLVAVLHTNPRFTQISCIVPAALEGDTEI